MDLVCTTKFMVVLTNVITGQHYDVVVLQIDKYQIAQYNVLWGSHSSSYKLQLIQSILAPAETFTGSVDHHCYFQTIQFSFTASAFFDFAITICRKYVDLRLLTTSHLFKELLLAMCYITTDPFISVVNTLSLIWMFVKATFILHTAN